MPEGDENINERMWLSCPFCGESDTRIEDIGVIAGKRMFAARCGCGALGPERYSEEDARRAWNTRYAVWPADGGAQVAYNEISIDDRERFADELEWFGDTGEAWRQQYGEME